MKWTLYNLLFAIAYVAMMPKFLVRMARRGGYANRFADRFGRYPRDVLARLGDGRPRVWVHAVSVGEVAVAGQLMAELRRQRPGIAFVLSVTSSTGWAQAQRQVGPDDVLVYGPLDYPGCVRRAVRAIAPLAYVITETELWPNVIRQVAGRGAPTFLVNARISDHSAPGYRRLRCWFGPVLNLLTKIYAQSDLDARRLEDAGCDAGRIAVTGTMKFDVAHRAPGKEAELRDYLAVAGSDLQPFISLIQHPPGGKPGCQSQENKYPSAPQTLCKLLYSFSSIFSFGSHIIHTSHFNGFPNGCKREPQLSRNVINIFSNIDISSIPVLSLHSA